MNARHSLRTLQLTPVALVCLMMAASPATAQSPPRLSAQTSTDELAASEARIAALEQRIQELERRIQTVSQATAALPAPAVSPRAARGMGVGAVVSSSAAAPGSANAMAAAGTTQTSSASGARSAAGSFEVDQAAAQRALERTLTQSGALLLTPGTYEVTPSFSYARSEQSSPVLAEINGGVVALNERRQSNEFTPRLDLRMGLPYNAQFEASLPYSFVRTKRSVNGLSETSASEDGIGDLTVGIAKTLVREKGARPDLIGRLSYNFGNGDTGSDTVGLGGGFRQIQAEVVALKRQDPLAFTASGAYIKSFKEDGRKPGDAAILSLGAVLAASPATSLQFGFSQIHRQKEKFQGTKLAGSSQTYGMLNLGTSSVLSRDMTLVAQIGVGLSDDAPKYSISVALPILFH